MTAFDVLNDEHRWVAWRYERRGKSLTKVPFSPNGKVAKSNDPATWGTREEARRRAAAIINGLGGGVGIELGDLGGDIYLAGIDLDSCLGEDRTLAEWAAPFLAEFPTYTEISPSQRGLKLFFYCAREIVRPFLDRINVHPEQWGCRRSVLGANAAQHGPAIEIYFAVRYFAVTSEHWPASPDQISLLDGRALSWLARLIPPIRWTGGAPADANNDSSRSALAFRKGRELRLAGKSFEEMVEALSKDPETDEWVRDKGLQSGRRELYRIWERAAPRQTVPEFSDEALALEFARRQADELRYVAPWGKWLIWSNGIWRFDDTLESFGRARALCRDESGRCRSDTRAFDTVKIRTIAAVEKLARADQRLSATIDQWDGNPRILLAGKDRAAVAIELTTGAKRRPLRDDYFTKAAAVPPNGGCPLWRAFLRRVTDTDQALQDYLQRVAGYSLTGLIDEHAMFFLWGTGANGKSVFINSLVGILGDYAVTAPTETFVDSPTDRHPTELAHLRGAHLVVAQETEKGRRWAESKIKSITGGDRITARFMRQDFFDFTPQFKLLIAGNHKPSLGTVDTAIRRRIHLIPFTVTIPENERDPRLLDKLRAEWPGILQWAIDGCLEWQRIGLAPPEAVCNATDEYLTGEDVVGRWIDECCVTAHGNWQIGADLWESWRKWAERNNERPGNRSQFGKDMVNRGYPSTKLEWGGDRGYSGIALRSAVELIPSGPDGQDGQEIPVGDTRARDR
jgi:putative DNA primase/helicase